MPKVTIVNHGPQDIEVTYDVMTDFEPVAPTPGVPASPGKPGVAATPGVPGGRRSVTHAFLITSAQQYSFETAVTGKMVVREAPKPAK